MSEFWGIVGSKREFRDRARALLGVFGRAYRSVLGSSVRGVMESRCDGVFGCRFGELPLGESRGVNFFLSEERSKLLNFTVPVIFYLF